MYRDSQLLENYEDALFAVLMDRLAADEGELLIEECRALQNDPSAVVPRHIDAAARKTIRKAFAARNRKRFLDAVRESLNGVPVILLACSALVVAACFAIIRANAGH